MFFHGELAVPIPASTPEVDSLVKFPFGAWVFFQGKLVVLGWGGLPATSRTSTDPNHHEFAPILPRGPPHGQRGKPKSQP